MWWGGGVTSWYAHFAALTRILQPDISRSFQRGVWGGELAGAGRALLSVDGLFSEMEVGVARAASMNVRRFCRPRDLNLAGAAKPAQVGKAGDTHEDFGIGRALWLSYIQ